MFQDISSNEGHLNFISISHLEYFFQFKWMLQDMLSCVTTQKSFTLDIASGECVHVFRGS